MKQLMITKTIQMGDDTDPILRFMQLINQGISSWLEAGRLAREEKLRDKDFPQKVEEASKKFVSAATVNRFAEIGVKVVPQLAYAETPGAKMLRKLPMDLQSEYVKEPCPLLVKGDNGWNTLLVDLNNLTDDQAKQVFASDHVRSEAEQRAWLEDQKVKKIEPPQVKDIYKLNRSKGVVDFFGPCQLTKRKLLQLAAELE